MSGNLHFLANEDAELTVRPKGWCLFFVSITYEGFFWRTEGITDASDRRWWTKHERDISKNFATIMLGKSSIKLAFAKYGGLYWYIYVLSNKYLFKNINLNIIWKETRQEEHKCTKMHPLSINILAAVWSLNNSKLSYNDACLMIAPLGPG